MRLPLLIAILAIVACAPVADQGSYLALAPIDDLLAQAAVTTTDPGPALVARAASLLARAALVLP